MTVPPLPLDAIRQPAFLYGPDGRIAEANDLAGALAGRPLAGRSLAAVVGIFDIRSPDGDRPLLGAELPAARALRGEEAVDLPLTITAADGRAVRVLATASPIRNGDEIVGALAIWQDVSAVETARAGAETAAEELRVQEEELRQQGDELVRALSELDRQRRLLDGVLDAMPHHVSLWDRNQRLVWSNERFAAALGEGRGALVGRTWRECWPGVPGIAPLVAGALRSVAAGEPVRHELDVDGPAGPGWRAVTFLPIFGDSVLVITEDVTGRRRAEEALRESEGRFRSVLDHSLDALYRFNLQTGRYEYASPAFERVFGRTAEELTSQNPGEAITWIHPDDLAVVDEGLARLEETGATEVVYRVRDRDGRYRWVSNHLSLVRNDSGRALYRDGLVRDITDQKEADLALREYAERLQRSNEELQRFAYVASHDLQEPLRSIISFSQLLERRYKGELDSDADEFIGFIVDGGNRMQRLITDLLQVSRVETAAKPLVPTDVGAVVSAAARSLDEAVRGAGASVTVGDLPAVMADPAQLEQVFANLISNAIKYRHPDRSPAIAISGERLYGMVEFAVRDNGIGIEEEYFDRIFEMFRRLHTHDRYEGTGIGLAVVKRIVERHGGTIRVESTPGEGSTFFFTVPAA